MPSDHMQPREAPPAGLVRLRARPVGGRAAECAEHVSQVTRTAQGHPACSLANGRPGSFLYRSFVFESMDRESSAPIADPRNDLAGGDQTDRRCIITSMKCGLRRGFRSAFSSPEVKKKSPAHESPARLSPSTSFALYARGVHAGSTTSMPKPCMRPALSRRPARDRARGTPFRSTGSPPGWPP